MERRILRCPHCGGAAYLNQRYSARKDTYLVFVRCDSCRSQGRIFESHDDPNRSGWQSEACDAAVRAWNQRFDDAETL